MSVSVTNLNNGKSAAVFYQNGKPIAADLITNDGGSILSQGGGNLVNTNGSNFKDLPGASFGSARGVLAFGTERIPTSGNGALIIRQVTVKK